MTFINLSKVFDTVNMPMLWEVLQRFGCSDKFVNIINAFHTDVRATVLMAGDESESFKVGVGVKQGCAMAPVLFNIYLLAANFLFTQRKEDEHSTHLTYRLDGSLFNLHQSQTRACPIAAVYRRLCSRGT